MKKNYLYLAMFALVALFATSCEKVTTEGLTRITYYPQLTLEGETTIILDKGGSYEEPGYSAVLNGEDVTDDVEVNSNVDITKSGVYSITYTVVNEDGFASSAGRTIIVLDPNDPVEGFYYTDPTSYRIAAATTEYGGEFEVLVIGNGDGTYNVDDVLAGWYAQRAGYGTDYAMQGLINVAADGAVSLLYNYVPGWGDAADDMTDATFDAATKTIKWNVLYAGMNFVVTMSKK